MGELGNEVWEYDHTQFCQPCPKCGGILIWGDLYDWPADYGGDPCGNFMRCASCKTVWENIWDLYPDDGEPAWPEGCFDDKDMVIGWALDGGYTNGCEGPVQVFGIRVCDSEAGHG